MQSIVVTQGITAYELERSTRVFAGRDSSGSPDSVGGAGTGCGANGTGVIVPRVGGCVERKKGLLSPGEETGIVEMGCKVSRLYGEAEAMLPMAETGGLGSENRMSKSDLKIDFLSSESSEEFRTISLNSSMKE